MIRQAQSRAKEARVKVARLLGRRATSRNERSEAKKLSPRRIQVPLEPRRYRFGVAPQRGVTRVSHRGPIRISN